MSIANNNPGNIRYIWNVTSLYQGCTGDDNGFCKFDTSENGIRAIGKLLVAYQYLHDINTIRGAITRWAPPTENDTEAYINAVSAYTGFGPDQTLDFTSYNTLQVLVAAIIDHENGQQPYSPIEIASGVYHALGELA